MFSPFSPNSSRTRLQLQFLEDRTQPANLRVLLVNAALPHAAELQAAATTGTITVAYNPDDATWGSLVTTLQHVSEAHGGAKIDHLGVVAHGRSGALSLGVQETLDRADTTAQPETWAALRQLLTPAARWDLYACAVAAGHDGQAFVRALAKASGADVYASTDAVGTARGADFVWEYHTAKQPRPALLAVPLLQQIPGLKLEDGFAPNQVKADADRPTGSNSPNLGLLGAPKTISNLELVAGKEDWFRFDTDGVGSATDNVRIQFTNANGNLDLYLYAADGTTTLAASESNGDIEQVSLAGRSAGTYYVLVYPRTDTTGNPNYSLQVTPPPVAPDDAYEPNDRKLDADVPTGTASPNVGLLAGTLNIANLALDGESDWFKFTTDGVGTVADYVRLDFSNSHGNVDLYVYEQDGFSYVGASESNGDFEQVSLAGKPAGTYYVQVYPRSDTLSGNPNYSLQIQAPPVAPDDAYEPNDGKSDADVPVGATSPNLGPVAGIVNIPDLVLDGESDWFKIQTTQPGTTANYVRLDFDNSDGNIDLYVYEQNGTTYVGASESNGDFEQVSLATKPAGTYYIQVYPRNNTRSGNHHYDLQVVAPGSGLTLSATSVTEGDTGTTQAIFTASRSNASVAASVDYTTADGTATAGTDFQATSGTLSFAIGELTKTISVPITGDMLDEPNETFVLNLSNPTNVLLNNTSVGGTIVDDDTAGTLNFSAVRYTVAENGTNAVVRVSRTGGSDGPVTVQYTTSPGSAVTPEDFTTQAGTLSFGPGELNKTITIPIINDNISELDETFDLFLSSPTGGAVLGEQDDTEVLISSNDRQPGTFQFSSNTYAAAENAGTLVLTVERVGGADGPATVKYATGKKTALPGKDYTTETGVLNFGDGETSKTIVILLLEDNLLETQETFSVTLSVPTGGPKLGQPRVATCTIENDERLVTKNSVLVGAGNSGIIKVLDGPTNTTRMTINAFPTGFKAGVRIATGDVTGDGADDIIVGAGPNGSATIRVFDGITGLKLPGLAGEFFHGFDQAAGVNVAAGDLDGDGNAEIIVSAGAGGGPHVKVFDVYDPTFFRTFNAYPGLTTGVRVATGDLDGDGKAEIITSPTAGDVGAVQGFTMDGLLVRTYDVSGAVTIATGDLDGDGRAELIVGAGAGGGPHVKVFDGNTGLELMKILVYPPNYNGGIAVAVGDVDGDGIYDLIVAPGAGSTQKVKYFHIGTQLLIRQISPLGSTYKAGYSIAGVR